MGFHSQESNQRSLSDEASIKIPEVSSRIKSAVLSQEASIEIPRNAQAQISEA